MFQSWLALFFVFSFVLCFFLYFCWVLYGFRHEISSGSVDGAELRRFLGRPFDVSSFDFFVVLSVSLGFLWVLRFLLVFCMGFVRNPKFWVGSENPIPNNHLANDAKLSLWGVYLLEMWGFQRKVDETLMESTEIDKRWIIEFIEVSEGCVYVVGHFSNDAKLSLWGAHHLEM